MSTPAKLGNLQLGNTQLSVPSVESDTQSVSQSLSMTVFVEAEHVSTILPVESELSLSDEATCNIRSVSAEQTIALSDTSRVPVENTESLAAAIDVTDEASAFNTHQRVSQTIEIESIGDTPVKQREASNTISFTQSADGSHVRIVEQSLSLTQATALGQYNLSVEDSLLLIDESRIPIHDVELESTITFSQEVISSIKTVIIDQSLSLSQSIAETGPIYESVTDSLQSVTDTTFDPDTSEVIETTSGLGQTVEITYIGTLTTTNVISFAQSANGYVLKPTALEGLATDSLTLSETAHNSIEATATDSLTLTQAATGVSAKVATDSLSSLGQTATVNVFRFVAASDTITLSQAVGYVLEKSDTLCKYTPFIGANDDPDAPTPPPANYPAAGGTTGFRLQYPDSGPVTDEVVLSGPNLGNRDRISVSRISRETRGGTLIVFAESTWPKRETLLMSFSGLSSTKAQELLTFMEDHLGEDIKLIDHEDRVWTGVILNVQDPVVQDGKGCQFTASFEFEGTKA